jgi:hypothetical protein
MGASTRLTVHVTDAQGEAVHDAAVHCTVLDPRQRAVASLPAFRGSGDIYRTETWILPHRTLTGTWHILADAQAGSDEGNCYGSFTVVASTSEILFEKYGFWLTPPNLINAEPQIQAERGDAQNGMIRWGGALPGMHITPANYVEVHWRAGDFRLGSAEAARRFLLEEIGDLGDVRAITAFHQRRFKQWDAWELTCSTYTWEETSWVIFHAPRVDKTYALATIVRLPPKTSNAHSQLLESFAVYPDVAGTGAAPVPLVRLLPGPELISPLLASRFRGLDDSITLRWEPVKKLVDNEYYQVTIAYTYREAWPVVTFDTRETRFVVPETLYHSPNCGVFNWRVRLMRQTGTAADGESAQAPVSHPSLYWYFWWLHPPGEDEFPALCPYAHYD